MPVRTGFAVWEGDLQKGKGKISVNSKFFEAPYSFGTRFGDATGTNPEELIGAAHAACFSMALSLSLGEAGFVPEKIETQSKVHIDKVDNGFKITEINLSTRAKISEISNDLFLKLAENAKTNCPVSKALCVPITLKAKLF
jgi:lipoyl-dependent peroxiredoxin